MQIKKVNLYRMIKLVRVFYLLPLLGLTVGAFAQQKINQDSLLRISNLFVGNITRTVSEALENQSLFGENYIYKLRLDSIQNTVPLP